MVEVQIRSAMSVPVELGGGPIDAEHPSRNRKVVGSGAPRVGM
jgi:hypothetical protein